MIAHRSRILLALCVYSVGFILWCLYFRSFFTEALFWFAILVMAASGSIIALASEKFGMRLTGVALIALPFRLAPLLRDPGGAALFTDATRHLSLVRLILATGEWHLGMGVERIPIYSNYPMTHIWGASISLVAGRTPEMIAVLVLPLLTLVLPVLFGALFFRELLNDDRAAAGATLLLTLNMQFIYFYNQFAYESFAILLFTLFLFVVWRIRSVVGSLIAVCLAFVIAMTHHFTSYNLVLSLSLMGLAGGLVLFMRRIGIAVGPLPQRVRDLKRLAILCFAIVGAYMLFIAVNFFRLAVSYGSATIGSIFLATESEQYRVAGAFVGYAHWQILVVYGSLAVAALLAGIGFFSAAMRRRLMYMHFLGILGGIMLTVFLAFLPGSISRDIRHRGWFFSYLFLAPLLWEGLVVACDTVRRGGFVRKAMAAAIVTTLLTGAVVLANPHNMQRYPPEYQVYNVGAFAQAQWYRTHADTGLYVAIMPFLDDIIGPYAGLSVQIGRVYGHQAYFEKLMPAVFAGDVAQFRFYRLSYVTVDERVDLTEAWHPFQFSRMHSLSSTEWRVDPGYSALSSVADRVYTNGIAATYAIT